MTIRSLWKIFTEQVVSRTFQMLLSKFLLNIQWMSHCDDFLFGMKKKKPVRRAAPRQKSQFGAQLRPRLILRCRCCSLLIVVFAFHLKSMDWFMCTGATISCNTHEKCTIAEKIKDSFSSRTIDDKNFATFCRCIWLAVFEGALFIFYTVQVLQSDH